MALTKLTNSDFTNKKINDLPNVPSESGMTATQLKQYFDNIPINIVGGLNGETGLNKLIDDLEGTDGASNIGTDAIDGMEAENIQDALEELKELFDTAISGNKFGLCTYDTTTYAEIETMLSNDKMPILKYSNDWYQYGGKRQVSNVYYHYFYKISKNNVTTNGFLLVDIVTCSYASVWLKDTTKVVGFDSTGLTANGVVVLKTNASGKLEFKTAEATESMMNTAIGNSHTHSNQTELNKIGAVQTSMTDSNSAVPTSKAVLTALAGKQNTLESGVNVKTINSQSIVGSGDIVIRGTNYTAGNGIDISAQDVISIADDYHDSTKQDTLVSGTNVKTINNQSILGSGDITITGEPNAYIKSASVNGNTLTLTNKDDTTTTFTPTATGDVESVNGQTGVVVLDAEDVGALPTGYHDSSKQDTIDANTLLLGGINYVTTAPTSANTIGLKFAVLSSAPATKYDGWIYIIPNS